MKRAIVIILVILLLAGGGAGGLMMMGLIPNPFNPAPHGAALTEAEKAAAELTAKKKFQPPTTGFDLVNGFSRLGVRNWCGNAASECYGFKLTSTTHIADRYDYALHFLRIDDVLQTIAGPHIGSESANRYGGKNTITKI